jgi:phosphoglycolate phosphatase
MPAATPAMRPHAQKGTDPLEPQLILFDIDGTLMSGLGAGRLAMERALLAVGGAEGSGEGVPTAGRTDPGILADMARRAGVATDAATMATVSARYLEELPRALVERGARLLPGVRPLLESLARDPRCRLALGTGNLEAGARIKLRSLGVDGFFPIGGFGDDTTDRAALLAAALRRARSHYGIPFAASDTVVVGDAAADVAAARANGMGVLAVATGGTRAPVLAELRPDALVADLTQTERLHAWLVPGENHG